jgi:hypothetical protein
MDISHFYKTDTFQLYVLFNSIREQLDVFENCKHWEEYQKSSFYATTDLIYIFVSLKRLKLSLENKLRFETAVDATSFFLFARILYDSLASLIHVLFKMINPSDSKKWTAKHSFKEMLKSLKNNQTNYFKVLKDVLDQYDFENTFNNLRDIRNSLKEASGSQSSKRLLYQSSKNYPNTGNLRNEVGYHLYYLLSFMDFIGLYFLMKIEEKTPILRLEKDHHGERRGYLDSNDLDLYKWFND